MNAALAEAVLQHALVLGVREFCVCTGSRNSDLVHGLMQHASVFRVHPFFEERSAAFFALGRQMATDLPVAVVTTSGTAVAELLPAAIEAHYQARPLIFITADRPTIYRGTGAPQAIEQTGLFGGYAHQADDIIEPGDLVNATSGWSGDHPLHLNVCFEEPREIPSIRLAEPSKARHHHRPLTETHALVSFLALRDPLIVMVGCWQPDASWIRLLEQLQAPILADLTSGLHGVASLQGLLVRGGDQTLARLNYARVLRLGGVPSFRAWRDLESRPDVNVFSASPRPFSGLARASTLINAHRTLPHIQTNIQEKPSHWRSINASEADRLDCLLDQYPACEVACLRSLFAMMPNSASAFLGNSLPIREAALAANGALPQSFYANRGANGIDGSVSTFLGLANVPSREYWGFFGDLTTLYDLSAPSILSEMPEMTIRLVVINNGGGKIFRLLPNWQGVTSEQSRVVENPHRFDFAAWAQSWGLGYACLAAHRTMVEQHWQQHMVIEVRPDNAQAEAFWAAWRQP